MFQRFFNFLIFFYKANQNEINENEIFDNVWNLIVGKRYLVRAALFDYLHNPITITENLNFKVYFHLYKN